jgi:hypothetical protein
MYNRLQETLQGSEDQSQHVKQMLKKFCKEIAGKEPGTDEEESALLDQTQAKKKFFTKKEDLTQSSLKFYNWEKSSKNLTPAVFEEPRLEGKCGQGRPLA